MQCVCMTWRWYVSLTIRYSVLSVLPFLFIALRMPCDMWSFYAESNMRFASSFNLFDCYCVWKLICRSTVCAYVYHFFKHVIIPRGYTWSNWSHNVICATSCHIKWLSTSLIWPCIKSCMIALEKRCTLTRVCINFCLESVKFSSPEVSVWPRMYYHSPKYTYQWKLYFEVYFCLLILTESREGFGAAQQTAQSSCVTTTCSTVSQR